MTAVKQLADRLNANPLFHMSLGSKELFHSNYLAWLTRKYPALMQTALAPWCEPLPGANRRHARREHGRLDLVLRFEDLAPLIIENKIFSLPDEAQLDRYSTGSLKKYPPPRTMVLLSLADPGWTGGVYTRNGASWRWRSYGEMASRLQTIKLAMQRICEYDFQTLEYYLAMVDALIELQAIVQIGGKSSQPVLLPGTMKDSMGGDSPLWASSRKLRVHAVAQHIRKAAGTDNVGAELKCGFSNGAPLIEAFLPMQNGDFIGWQYQHEQFRLALQLCSLTGKKPEHKKARESRAAALQEWFDFGEAKRLLGTAGDVGKKVFNHYNPDFIYRYVQAKKLTVEQLAQLSVFYLNKAKTIADRNVI